LYWHHYWKGSKNALNRTEGSLKLLGSKREIVSSHYFRDKFIQAKLLNLLLWLRVWARQMFKEKLKSKHDRAEHFHLALSGFFVVSEHHTDFAYSWL
jgi:hypothetical protein